MHLNTAASLWFHITEQISGHSSFQSFWSQISFCTWAHSSCLLWNASSRHDVMAHKEWETDPFHSSDNHYLQMCQLRKSAHWQDPARESLLCTKNKTVAWPAFHIQRLLQALFSMNKVIEGFQSVILHPAEKPNNVGTFIRHLERGWSNKHFLYPLSARAELGAQGEDAEWGRRNMKMNEGPADGDEQALVCEGAGGGLYVCPCLCAFIYF